MPKELVQMFVEILEEPEVWLDTAWTVDDLPRLQAQYPQTRYRVVSFGPTMQTPLRPVTEEATAYYAGSMPKGFDLAVIGAGGERYRHTDVQKDAHISDGLVYFASISGESSYVYRLSSIVGWKLTPSTKETVDAAYRQ